MKNWKKLISSILTLTLFAGAVNNFTCFAITTNSKKPNIEQLQQELIDFNRCRDYESELNWIKIGGSFNHNLKKLNDLKEKISAKPEDEAILEEQIKSTELYLYKRELDDIKEYTNEKFNNFCGDVDFLKVAFNRLENLNNKINENYKTLLAEDIKSTKLYLIKMQSKALKKIYHCWDNCLRYENESIIELASKNIIQARKGIFVGICISAVCYMVAFAANIIQLNVSLSDYIPQFIKSSQTKL